MPRREKRGRIKCPHLISESTAAKKMKIILQVILNPRHCMAKSKVKLMRCVAILPRLLGDRGGGRWGVRDDYEKQSLLRTGLYPMLIWQKEN